MKRDYPEHDSATVGRAEAVLTGEHGVQLESETFLLKDKREAHFS